MSRHSTWEGPDAIRFGRRPGPDRVIGDAGMLFVPVSLATGTWLCEGPPGHYAQVYPARGGATVHALPQHTTTPGRALARLVGTGRAGLLHALRQPATSTELAARLQQSLGTVGGHLAVLRDAGRRHPGRPAGGVPAHRTRRPPGGRRRAGPGPCGRRAESRPRRRKRDERDASARLASPV
ncbi:helix-turn-helix domain-containing protein [Streptomyces noursei]|uniref:helix-turn-helix domain-containing protein n=1 Tax=Streptomyces noursei TaxID=1971 RepID=UPI0035D7AAEC